MVTRRSRLASATKPAPAAGLILYVAPGDPWAEWAALLFAEKAIDAARTQTVLPGRPNEDLLVINPELRLPALTDRELLLTGARVIAEYLDERYPHPRLMPQDPAGRAKVRMVLDQFEKEIFPALQESRADRATAKARAALVQAVAACSRWFGAKGYFLGAEYTQVDLAWAVWLRGVQQAGLSLPENAIRYRDKLAQRPVISAYLKSPT